MIYIYKLRQNLNLIRFFQNFSVTNYSKHSCRGYGDILGINNIQSIILKRVCISKSIFRTINKRCKEWYKVICVLLGSVEVKIWFEY